MIRAVGRNQSCPGNRLRLYTDETDGPSAKVRIPHDTNFGIAHRRPAFQGIAILIHDGAHHIAHAERSLAAWIVFVGKDLTDGSEFVDFKPEFDMGTVCGFMALEGKRCGVIGNNAPITAKGAAKAAQFIQLCEQAGTPLLFLHNTTGFLVGTESERAGIIKHGAKLIQAVTNTTVPKITLVLGGSFGAGNYAMAGRGIEPDFMFAWPRSVVAVMGPAQAGSVLRTVAQAKMARSKEINPEDTAKLDALEQHTVSVMEAKSRALANSARLWDDGLIDPRDTRPILAFVLSICCEAKQKVLNPTSFGIGRL